MNDMELLCVGSVLCDVVISAISSSSVSSVSIAAGADDVGLSCAASPPTLCRAQNGVNSLVIATRKILGAGSVDAGGAVLENDEPGESIVLCVL